MSSVAALNAADCPFLPVNSDTQLPSIEELVEKILEMHRSCRKDTVQMKRWISQYSPEHVDDILRRVMHKEIAEGKQGLFDSCLSLLPDEKVNDLVRIKVMQCHDFEQNVDQKKAVQSIEELAAYVHKNWPDERLSPAMRTMKREYLIALDFIKNFIPNLINTFMTAFSLFKIGQEPGSAWEANSMLEVYYKFMMIPATLVVVLTAILPIITWQAYLIGVGVVVGIAAILYIYIRWVKPCPNDVEAGENLTEKVKRGELTSVYGRFKEIESLIEKIDNWEEVNERNGICMHGPSGVGKSELINGLAIELFNRQEYRHKKVFSICTPNFVEKSAYQGIHNKLKSLFDRFKGHNNIVLVFEEIHVLGEQKDSAPLRSFLKQLDHSEFPCIALTTTEEYKKFVEKDETFASRFRQVVVLDSMGKEQIKEVLVGKTVESDRNELVDEAALDKIAELSASNCQPMKAIHVFRDLMVKCQSSFQNYKAKCECKKKSYDLRCKKNIHRLRSCGEAEQTDIENLAENRQLHEEVEQLRKETMKVDAVIDAFQKNIDLYRAIREPMKRFAGKALKSKKPFHENRPMREFFKKYLYLMPEVGNVIGALEKELNCYGITPRITVEMVEEFFKNQQSESTA